MLLNRQSRYSITPIWQQEHVVALSVRHTDADGKLHGFSSLQTSLVTEIALITAGPLFVTRQASHQTVSPQEVVFPLRLRLAFLSL